MKPQKHICFVGASTVEGLGDSTGQGWVGRLAARYRGTAQAFVPYNLGVRGNTVAMMAARAPGECQARFFHRKLAGIVLSASVNDVAYLNGQGPRTPYRSMMRSFEGLLDSLSALAPLIVLGPGPVIEERLPMLFYGYDFSFKNADIEEAEQGFAQICRDRNLPFLPSFSALHGNPAYRAALEAEDGVHPNDDGYAIMAEQVAGWQAWQDLL